MNLNRDEGMTRNGEDEEARAAERFVGPDGKDERRRERMRQVVEDAMEEALALTDPFDVLFAANTATLAQVATELGERVVATLQDRDSPLEEASEAHAMFMRTTRQLERHTQLRRRDRELLRQGQEKPFRVSNRFEI